MTARPPRLLLLNGPPAAGKSTLARRYADERPPALALDVDVLRTLVGGRLADPAGAGVVAWSLAVVMARAHLLVGHDVVVPQLLARPDLADALGRVADEAGAEVVEVLVDAVPEVLSRRLARRSADGLTTADRDVAVLLGREGGGLADLELSRRAVLELVAGRPHVVRLLSRDGDPEGTFRDLLTLVDAAKGARPRRGRAPR